MTLFADRPTVHYSEEGLPPTPQMAAARIHVMVSLPGIANARDYIESGVLDTLAKHFDVSFVLSHKAQGSEILDRYGQIHRLPPPTHWRTMVYTVGKGCWHYYRRRTFVISDRHRRYRSLISLGWLRRRIVNGAIALHIEGALARFIRWGLRLRSPDMLPGHRKVDVLLMAWGLEALINDDTVRCARDKRIPVIGIQANLDNIATKTSYEPPPYAAVWGVQDILNCVHSHGFRADHVFVTGSPRFEPHKEVLNKLAARRVLGLPVEKRLIFFCGTGVPFDETDVLRKLQAAYEEGAIPSDVQIIYRPHPHRHTWAGWEGTKALPAETEFLRNAPNDQHGLNGAAFYSQLFAASDAVITPFSTMTIEAASYGLPVMCVAYDEPSNAGRFDWKSAMRDAHLVSVFHGDWAVICDASGKVVSAFHELLSLIADPEIAALAKVAHQFANRTGKKSVGQRLVEAVNTVIQREAEV
jgi:hypothetical protein